MSTSYQPEPSSAGSARALKRAVDGMSSQCDSDLKENAVTKTAVTTDPTFRVPADAGRTTVDGRLPDRVPSSMPVPSRVVVVASEARTRSMICEELRTSGFVSIEFERSDEVSFGPADRVQCAVLALNGEDRGEREGMVRSLLSSAPNVPVVVVSKSDDTEAVIAAMRAGARDYLRHPIRPGDLAHSVRGQIERANRERTPPQPSLPPGFAMLSRCECEVLDAVIRGCSTKQIAVQLGRVEKTIEYHRERIMEKLGVGTAVQLVRLATLHDWTWDGSGLNLERRPSMYTGSVAPSQVELGMMGAGEVPGR